MSSGEKVRLGDVAKVNPKASRNVDDGDLVSFLPLASVNTDGTTETGEIKERGEVKKGHPYFMRGDILVAKITPSFENGKIAIASCETEDGYSSTEFHVVRPDTSRVDPNYLLAYLRSGRVRLFCSKRMKGSAGQRRVPKEVLSGLTLGLPPINIQRERAAKFNKISSMIAAHNEQIAQLDQLVKSRFVEMFGDLLNEADPAPAIRLEDCAVIASGITKGRKVSDNANVTTVPYMAVSNVKSGYIDYGTVKSIEVTAEELERYRLEPNDVLMTEGGDPDKLGRGALITAPPSNCIHQNHVFRVRLNREIVRPRYLEMYLQSNTARDYFLHCAKRTTGIATINKRQISNLPVVTPMPEQQDEFIAFAAQVDKTRAIAKQQVDKLQTLYDSLAQDYFS